MNAEVVASLKWAVGVVVLALVATLARKLGLIDGETVTRLVVGANGLMIASFGNRMPKAFVPEAWARQLRRVSAWSLVLSGLAYAGLWAFAPITVAVVGGCIAVATGIAVTIAYCFVLRSRANTQGPHAA